MPKPFRLNNIKDAPSLLLIVKLLL